MGVLLLLTAITACSHLPGGRGLPGRGLKIGLDQGPSGATSAQSAQLVWELNLGVLNDRDLPAVSSHGLTTMLDRAAARIERHLGIRLRFLPDQPQDARFLMERGLRGRAYLNRLGDPHNLILSLDGDHPGNRARARRAVGVPTGLLERLEAYRRSKATVTGMPLLYQKPPAGLHAWSSYMAVQPRYDIIITNALIFHDDLRSLGNDRRVRTEAGMVRKIAAPAAGRRGMEGYAAVVSVYRDAARLAREAAARRLVRPPEDDLVSALRLLIGPLSVRRRSYLRGIARWNAGQRKRGCLLMGQGRAFAGPGHVAVLKGLNQQRARERERFLNVCRKLGHLTPEIK